MAEHRFCNPRTGVRFSLGAPSFVVRKVKGAWASHWLDNDQIPHLPQISLFHSSTAVVQLTVNQLVVGSIPACGAKYEREKCQRIQHIKECIRTLARMVVRLAH